MLALTGCRACLNGEHLCQDCGHAYCVDHIHRHEPCTPRRNMLINVRWALAEARIMEIAATRSRERLQDALKELEGPQPGAPAAPSTPDSDKTPTSRCVR